MIWLLFTFPTSLCPICFCYTVLLFVFKYIKLILTLRPLLHPVLFVWNALSLCHLQFSKLEVSFLPFSPSILVSTYQQILLVLSLNIFRICSLFTASTMNTLITIISTLLREPPNLSPCSTVSALLYFVT